MVEKSQLKTPGKTISFPRLLVPWLRSHVCFISRAHQPHTGIQSVLVGMTSVLPYCPGIAPVSQHLSLPSIRVCVSVGR